MSAPAPDAPPASTRRALRAAWIRNGSVGLATLAVSTAVAGFIFVLVLFTLTACDIFNRV